MVRRRVLAMALGLTAVILNSYASAQLTVQMGAKKATAKKKTGDIVAVFHLNRPIVETPTGDEPLLGSAKPEALKDLIARVKKAGQEDRVKGIAVILGSGASMGAAQIEELHNALSAIRDSGKPVFAYSDSLNFGGLALSSAASRISVAPVGDVMVLGMYGEQLYLRGLLDKLRIQPDFQTCGDYKSAGEIFMRKSPSPQAAEMHDWLYDSIFESYVGLIAKGRGVDVPQVKKWLDDGLYSADRAMAIKLIDAAEVREDFVRHIRHKVGDDIRFDTEFAKEEKGSVDLSSPFAFLKIWSDMVQASQKKAEGDAVAIVYVDGPIVPGEPEPSPFGSQGTAYSDPIRKALDKVADDDSVKAVVLRVDSPGGSAVASEIILQATRRVAAKKPFVVSMGNVAGSGGYYVACGTDTIFADPTTITASIGVVTGKLATRDMWESMGVHWHPIQRGKNAGMLASADVMTEEQKKLMQSFMDEIYGVFKGHVLKARGDRLKKPIDELAGGRVFTGKQALELGLIDRLGSLDDAIQFVAAKAGLEEQEYKIRVVPPPANFMEQLLKELVGQKDEDEMIGVGYVPRTLAQQVWTSAQPLLGSMQPHRAAALRRAVIQLETLQRESVSLMMPELILDN